MWEHHLHSLSVDDIPILLRSLLIDDQHVLSPFEVHCREYSRHFNRYCQHTGPFRVTWCPTLVTQEIEAIPDARRKQQLFQAYDFLMDNRDSSYSRFVRLQANDHPKPFLYQIFTSPMYRGIECALWPCLYYKTSMCESVLEGQENRASSKISFLHKVLSPVVYYSLFFDILQYQFDRWLFKTITGAVNSWKAAGCSPNRSLENKTFSRTFWQHQHLYLDAVRQFSFPLFFLSVPTSGHFPFPHFLRI